LYILVSAEELCRKKRLISLIKNHIAGVFVRILIDSQTESDSVFTAFKLFLIVPLALGVNCLQAFMFEALVASLYNFAI
jgi:hypothetical protein